MACAVLDLGENTRTNANELPSPPWGGTAAARPLKKWMQPITVEGAEFNNTVDEFCTAHGGGEFMDWCVETCTERFLSRDGEAAATLFSHHCIDRGTTMSLSFMKVVISLSGRYDAYGRPCLHRWIRCLKNITVFGNLGKGEV
mmetsp:Transcript_136286/g.236430  ORF Transcript_136286/g.236430 Transcript_136286/m.236430 type:complete len:143 (+) Transcript_136286:208-636(+)